MHLPKENEREPLSPVGTPVPDLDLDFLLESIEKPTASMKNDRRECPECRLEGRISYIDLYQMNFHEAMYMCPDVKCPYPGRENRLVEDFIIKREVSAMVPTEATHTDHRVKLDSFSDILNDIERGLMSNPADYDSVIDDIFKSNLIETHDQTAASIPDDLLGLSEISVIAEDNLGKRQNTVDETVPVDPSLSSFDINADFESDMPMDVYSPPLSNMGADGIQNQHGIDCAVQDIQTGADIPVEPQPAKFQSEDENLETETFNESYLVLPTIHLSSSMLQWVNDRNSCWLDSILQIAVCSKNIRSAIRIFNTSLHNMWAKLINTYDETQSRVVELSSRSSYSANLDSLMARLGGIREAFFTELKEKNTHLAYGKFQSLVEILPLSLKLDSKLENVFKAKILWHSQCGSCLCQSVRRSDKTVITMPNTMGHFHPLNAQFNRSCYQCKSECASTSIRLEELPPCIVFHFQKGLPHSNLRLLDFAFRGHLYCIVAVVQYIVTGAKHFVTWIRDIRSDRWLKCDDLGEPICEWTPYQPDITPSQIHMVFWERQYHCDVGDMSENDLNTITNMEVVELSKKIPDKDIFSSQEDTIVIDEEDGGSNVSAKKVGFKSLDFLNDVKHDVSQPWTNTVHSQSRVFESSRREVDMQHACGLDMGEGSDQMCLTGQNMRVEATIARDSGRTLDFIRDISVEESSSGAIHNQIYSSYTSPVLVDNDQSHNLATVETNGSTHTQNVKRNVATRRIRRHFKLSGYSKRTNSSNRYTPMRASRSCSSIKTPDSACDTASEMSCNSKGDSSETRSEISDVSDILSESDLHGCRRNLASSIIQRDLFGVLP